MACTLFGLEMKDWAVVIATLLGPIFAVQAQKAIELIRESRRRKTFLFEQLMATRAARVSPEHVRALNMIDLVFFGKKIFWYTRRTVEEQRVLDGWNEYRDHLNNKGPEEQIQTWGAKGDELFTNLLFAISEDLKYKFDRVQLKRGAYSPIAHSEIETELTELRKAAVSLVTGKHALKMNVVGFPTDQEMFEANKAAIQNLGKALKSGVLQVEVIPQNLGTAP